EDHGDQLLHVAARIDHAGIIPLLVNYGAEVGCQSRSGLTPLMVAIKEMHERQVQELLQCGSDPNA
ncbi:hypothetical protein AOQ84DRAFT_267786, partial [Glonium stellatum]